MTRRRITRRKLARPALALLVGLLVGCSQVAAPRTPVASATLGGLGLAVISLRWDGRGEIIADCMLTRGPPSGPFHADGWMFHSLESLSVEYYTQSANRAPIPEAREYIPVEIDQRFRERGGDLPIQLRLHPPPNAWTFSVEFGRSGLKTPVIEFR